MNMIAQPTPQEARDFALSLRRILMLMQIMHYNIDWLRDMQHVPKEFRKELNAVKLRTSQFIHWASKQTTAGTWKEIKQDMNHERIHDISLLLDLMSCVENVDDFVQIIDQTIKEQQNENNTIQR